MHCNQNLLSLWHEINIKIHDIYCIPESKRYRVLTKRLNEDIKFSTGIFYLNLDFMTLQRVDTHIYSKYAYGMSVSNMSDYFN